MARALSSVMEMSVWDAGTNPRFPETANSNQNGTLCKCKLTQSLCWWLQSSSGANECVWRRVPGVSSENLHFLTVTYEQRKPRCEYVRSCENAYVQIGSKCSITHSADPDREAVSSSAVTYNQWFCTLSCCFYACASSRRNMFSVVMEIVATEQRVIGGPLPFVDAGRWKHKRNSCVMVLPGE